jgi:hypothetical protein
VDRSSPDPSGRLTRLFLVAAVLVAGASFTWSKLSDDPSCTDGPCSHDGPLILGAAVEAILVSGYLLGMVVLAVKEHRRGSDEADGSPDIPGA